MPKKYHIHVETAEPRFHPIGKYTTIEFREDCAGSCRNCVKKKCVYNIFKEGFLHASHMKEPEYLYTCQSCFRCVQECTKGIFSRVINPDYRTLGDDHWRSDIIHRLWYQAHTGNVPVSGAGYRGPFVASGFDAMWTDMSEIVRPTRDGIHGREYINTCIELSRRIAPLAFDANRQLVSEVPAIFEIPIPLIFRLPDSLVVNTSILLSAAQAAQTLGTLMLVEAGDYSKALAPYASHLVPGFTRDAYLKSAGPPATGRCILLHDEPGVEDLFPRIREEHRDGVILVDMPLNAETAARALTLTKAGVDTLYFYADDHGRELNRENPRHLKDMIREIHLHLVESAVRQKVNLLFSGGIALAEHMAKAIICGADGVVADIALLLALECRLCYRCRENLSCPVKLEEGIDPDWGCRRIVNLIGAWHSQLLEVMGAMGIREARRLRGEVGRSMWFEDLESENFGPVFGQRKVAGF
jgi:ferredoxin